MKMIFFVRKILSPEQYINRRYVLCFKMMFLTQGRCLKILITRSVIYLTRTAYVYAKQRNN